MITSLDGAVADPERFATVFDAHYEEIRRYIGRRLDLGIAEDLAAETFLIAFRRRDSFDAAKGGIRPWLYGIATNLIGRHRRAELQRYRALARSGPTRAALYRMLAGLPEVRVVDGVADLDGRVGVGLVFGGGPVRRRSGQHLPVQQQIVIDRESGDLLAVQGAEIQLDGSQVGEPYESYVIKKQGWTDEVPVTR